MSDSSQGPGWWQASDGKWYPPEQAPGYQQPYQAPGGGGPYGGGGGGGPYGGGGAANFDVGTAFSWTIAKYQAHLQPLLILGLVVGGIPFLMQFVSYFSDSVTLDLAFGAGSYIVSIILSMLTVQAGLELTTTGTLNTGDMWRFKANIVNYVLASILFTIALFIGCLALCIGLIVVWLILGLWQFVMVERGEGIIESLTGSKDLVLGPGFGNTFLGMLVFLVLSMVAGLAGSFCPFIAIIGIATIPLASLFGAYVYRSYSGQSIAA